MEHGEHAFGRRRPNLRRVEGVDERRAELRSGGGQVRRSAAPDRIQPLRCRRRRQTQTEAQTETGEQVARSLLRRVAGEFARASGARSLLRMPVTARQIEYGVDRFVAPRVEL